MGNFIELTEHSGLITWGGNEAALIMFNAWSQDDRGIEMVIKINNSPVRIFPWGSYNSLPQYREDVIQDNNIVGTLIETKRDLTVGSGIVAYKEQVVDGEIKIEHVGMPREVQGFVGRLEESDYFSCAAGELIKHANVFTEFVRTKGGKIHSFYSKPCKYIRAGKKDGKGRISKYYFYKNWNGESDWETSNQKPIPIPVFNPLKKQPKFILHDGMKLLRPDGYYYSPPYWGGKEWIELSNAIPKFHKNNLQNSYSIKYHIEIPKGYFSKNSSSRQNESPRPDDESNYSEVSARQEFVNRLNEWLAGYENAGRAIVTDYEINRAIGKDFPGIKITPLKVDMQDKTLLDLFEKSNQANISAQAIHPTLAAIETAGKLSSGSEIRNAYLMYIAIKTPTPRKILLRPLYLAARINGWDPELKFAFRDVRLTKLDENKSGAEANLTL